jgi:hypothetical protein
MGDRRDRHINYVQAGVGGESSLGNSVGVTSLSRDFSTHAVFTATNSPTNFATQSGSLPEPGTAGILLLSGICITVRRCRGC